LEYKFYQYLKKKGIIMRRNVLRELLDNNKPSIGTTCHTLWAGMAEVKDMQET
jgi:hypothetical protein